MNKYKQARYDKGLCISCGKRPYIEGNKRCNECIKLLREKSKADYYFKKSHGFCVKCGKPMYKDSNRLCYEHYIQEKTTDKNRSLKWKNILN